MRAQPSDSQHLDLDAVVGNGREAQELDCGCKVERSRATQGAILGLLLGDDHHGIWSLEEIERTVSVDALTVGDAIADLLAAGLVHELERFVLATQAARSFNRLEL